MPDCFLVVRDRKVVDPYDKGCGEEEEGVGRERTIFKFYFQ